MVASELIETFILDVILYIPLTCRWISETLAVNFINILQAAFAPIFFS